MIYRLLFAIITCTTTIYASARGLLYTYFDNIVLHYEAHVINAFAQDDQGMVWVGTDNGLYSYDGYSSRRHAADDIQSRIYCINSIDNSTFAIGTDRGVYFFNYRSERCLKSGIHHISDVRTLLLDGNFLWIGTLNGLYRYHLPTQTTELFEPYKYPQIPHHTIYSIVKQGGDIYIGTYNGLCRYRTSTGHFENIPLPANRQRNNQFVNVILNDSLTNCLWIGMEGQLLQLSLAPEKLIPHTQFKDNSVKSLALDQDGALLVGTDNGLYIYHPEIDRLQHVVHDSRNQHSLSNNIIWSIFPDSRHNIWLGTDYNISLFRFNAQVQMIPISQITGTGSGNRFYAMYKGSEGDYWLGGTNGIIYTPVLNRHNNLVWYRMDNHRHPISHNRIRHIYEDAERQLWIATDGSINRFDRRTNQFVHYSITDSTHTYNSNWAYHLLEDDAGKLWVATCLGGLFIVDKKSLLNSDGNYVADLHLSTSDGLSGNFINQLVPDGLGNIWVLYYQNGIDKISIKEKHISKVQLPYSPTSNATPNYILCDANRFIWAALNGELLRIEPQTEAIQSIKLTPFGQNEILTLVEVDTYILASTASRVWMVDKQTMFAERLNIPAHSFTSGFYDAGSSTICLGGNDNVALLSAPWPFECNTATSVALTSLYINNTHYSAVGTLSPGSIRYQSEINLDYDQNNLTFEFSDFNYSLTNETKYIYSLAPLDNHWNQLLAHSNHISYSNLGYGQYTLSIAKLDASGNPSASPFNFRVNITPPWYYTPLMKLIYIILICTLLIWIIHFFRMKHNLRIERIEKEKTQELSKLKLDFLTNVSHEFKTPLSLIIAPVSRLLLETKSESKRKQLETIRQNALKLNALIRQIIEFNRDDKFSSDLIRSKTEIIGFVRGIFALYEETYGTGRLRFVYTANVEQLYTGIDVIKIESVITNILTNACKFTHEGEIVLDVCYQQVSRQLLLSIKDSGIGIPAKELPLVFERFYQSSKTAGKKEGTGIGLYLVKRYTEQHHGQVYITSEEGKGTTVSLTLPVVEEELPLGDSPADENAANLPLCLIVEDSPEIAQLIQHILSPAFCCEIAHNGRQGLEKCRTILPALIVSDVMMPVMNAIDMVKQIKKEPAISNIPIIMLTAKDDKDTELKSIKLNVDVFIPKPFDPEMLLKRAMLLVEKKEQLAKQVRIETLSTPQPIEATSPDERFLATITQLIENRIDDTELNVNALSLYTGVSSKQIYRKVKQLTGKAPVEYIRSIRLKKAAMLIAQKKFTIAEVMYMVGFSNASYFSKCFQNEFGKTPRQYQDEG